MKLVSYLHNGKPGFGAEVDTGIVELDRHFGDRCKSVRQLLHTRLLPAATDIVAAESSRLDPAEVTYLPPIPNPDKMLGIGRNYADHVRETHSDTPEYPRVFFKHISAVVGCGQPIIRPSTSPKFDYEGELAVVIGRGGRSIDRQKAFEHIAGYTCFNDGTVRDFQKHSLAAGKNFNRSSSVGPWLVTADEVDDPTQLTLMTRVNGQEVQRSRTDCLIFDIPFLIEYISTWLELKPGDLIATGTPSGVGSRREPPQWLVPGDRVEVEISGLGILQNDVIDQA